ncbi:hypothetical protein [Yersinia ruckeri]|uniref:hypothetical protein n=1 Tax=Yersinia ruckeri TaxID=29486 RepID=UPI0008FE97F1|nr:hypothetical protein [Yersinia ruckeri]OJB95764.1 hypothetical protein AXW59_07415 [Yersinia ruckeri]OJB98565.1 hypothetical protein AXW58_07395 [Yersinia ruckeri]OJC00213.1 hypothetical protein AXW57_07410 [Yersinia ruckeri]
MKFTKKVYKKSPEYTLYTEARFANKSAHSFEFDGHRWAYEHTGFDDTGDYDLLYRFTDNEIVSVETADDLSVRDYFAAKAMAAIVRRYDGHSFGGGPQSPQYKELACDSYLIADAMLAARSK